MQKRIENPGALAAIVDGLRGQGKVIVLAVGAFECLRPAEVRYLEDARSRGDYLLVGVNPKWTSPAAARGKKASGPRVPARDRAEMVAALRVVDYVTIFEDRDASALMRLLKPGILAHSAPWTERTAPERQLAQELGATIMICGDARRAAPSSGKLLSSRKSR